MGLDEDAVAGSKTVLGAQGAQPMEQPHSGLGAAQMVLFAGPEDAHAQDRARCVAHRLFEQLHVSIRKVAGVAGLLVE